MKRPVTITATAMLAGALLGGCGSGRGAPVAGADLSKIGPSAVPVRTTYPTPAATETTSAPPSASPAAVTAVSKLRDTIAAALRPIDPGASTSLAIEQRAAAQNQLAISWTVGSDQQSVNRGLVRSEAATVLDQVKHSTLHYGSAVLMVTGVVRGPANSTDSVRLVRAKYSHALLTKTDFPQLTGGAVFTIVDDKAAELDPSVR